MRTTLLLDDEVLREAKRLAAESNVTLSDLVERALREFLRPRSSEAEPPFRMVTYGADAPRTHHEPSDFKRVLEAEDVERFDRNRRR